ncbi:hypothetical protein [Cognatiyoonia sp. IB215182]|uniref:hypothetical protein n=1 Tax=Cognatiyoonia sp. IB215182 TaxID=3097353 RepID=UPI002A166850|nr:hypothetical protein [Cognatiyoonia sp. IB215182]MDX8354134.1 hypothetical protein [Cognatiyoonia sp. IB215182]
MINPPRLTFCTYLSSWSPEDTRLEANVLIIPIGDPSDPLTNGLAVPNGPPFAGTTIEVQAHIGDDPTILPTLADVPASTSSLLNPPPEQAAIFDEFRDTLDLSLPPEPAIRAGSSNLKKYLPLSYRKSFGFTAPSTPLAVIDGSYHCAKRCPPSKIPEPTPNDERLSWGELFAMLLRQPQVARAAGLIHTISLDVGTTYQNGGWLFVTSGAGGAYHDQVTADPTFARWFATRVPALDETPRPVFTSVLFPVAADATAAAAFGPLDQVYPEAIAFDDGFAKIVHASQPRSTDANDEEDEDEEDRFPPPLMDAGLRLGWDDESIVERLDRGLSAASPDGQPLPDAPSGAAGYRIDVRAPGTANWNSLCRIASPGMSIGTANLPAFETELTVEVHPAQLDKQYWLPPSYTQWRGGSLVADTVAHRDVLGEPQDAPLPYDPVGADALPLRYGETYEFRVRMVDATGGGPQVDEAAVNSAEAPIARHMFRRYVPLGELGNDTAEDADIGEFTLSRPGIGWPQAAFSDAPNALDRMAAQAQANQLAGVVRPLALPDPDAQFVEFRVLVLHPRLDPLADDQGFVELYRTTRAFPDLDPTGAETGPLTVTSTLVDCARLSDITWPDSDAPPGSLTGPLMLPTGRKVRVVAHALGPERSNYWGVPTVRRGAPLVLTPTPIEVLPSAEPQVFLQNEAAERIASVYLRPDPSSDSLSEATVTRRRPSRTLATRLAGATGLVEDEAVLLPEEGRRTIFACHGLKHAMAPDRSSVLLSSPDELGAQWLNVVKLTLERDWTWLAYAGATFNVTRRIELIAPGPDVGTFWEEDLGTIAIQNTISPRAAKGEVNRDSFDFCLIDGFKPPVAEMSRKPHELSVTYTVTLNLKGGGTETATIANNLPVTAPPRQIPKIVATGHAFGDYKIFGDYEGTGVRDRMLWVEFEEPLDDPRDAFFARVLASTTDPMLMPDAEPLADPPAYDKAPLDPEFVRVIRPDQVQDLSGLGVAQRMIPCTPENGEPVRHYLLPIPPTLTASSPELFGFFTYEFTVGHDVVDPQDPWWSTAQARFGPPLILEGVQHPAPALPIDVHRNGVIDEYALSSAFARPVKDGVNYMPLQPATEIWFVVYARIARADGESWQNVKLGIRKSRPARRNRRKQGSNIGGATRAEGRFKETELTEMLADYGLPQDTPLTFLAVELLPEPNGFYDAPLSGDLGDVRVLRTSRLVSAGDRCCI